jgi:uncharacterized protein YjbJ (UPF0337 family)
MDAVGRLQQRTGAAIGSSTQQHKGMRLRVEGTALRAIGDAEELLKDIRRKRAQG